MSNSSLVKYTRLSPNHSGKRTHKIDRITPHCVVGQLSVESLGNVFAPTSRQASSNYGIGTDGRIAMYVEECNRSLCSSSNSNDQRAVTIECASDLKHPYAMNDKVYNALIDLCVDICSRNGKDTLLWFSDKEKSLNYSPKSNEMVITVHRWFANKSCPGDWLYNRLGDLAKKVTEKLKGDNSMYRVQVGAYEKKENAENMLKKLKAAGFNGFIVEDGVVSTPVVPTPAPVTPPKKSVNELAREVINGKWGNGSDRKKRLTEAGYDYSTIQKRVNELLK